MKKDPALIMALEANDFTARAVIVNEEQEMVDSLETKSYEIMKLVRWAQHHVHENANLSVVGSPLDPWTQEFHHAFVDTVSKLYWLPSDTLRQVFRHASSWQQKRRLHRARLLAYIGYYYLFRPYHLFPKELALQWEYRAAQETVRSVADIAYMSCIKLDSEDGE